VFVKKPRNLRRSAAGIGTKNVQTLDVRINQPQLLNQAQASRFFFNQRMQRGGKRTAVGSPIPVGIDGWTIPLDQDKFMSRNPTNVNSERRLGPISEENNNQ